MAEQQLQFSEDMIEALEKVVCEHDTEAQDPGVFMQYLGITIGYTLSRLNMGQQTKQEFLQQLFGFTQHVMDNMSKNQSAPAQQQEDAFGIWRPGD